MEAKPNRTKRGAARRFDAVCDQAGGEEDHAGHEEPVGPSHRLAVRGWVLAAVQVGQVQVAMQRG
jgi:hypothetical protein